VTILTSGPRITNVSALDFVARLGSARKFPNVFQQAERLVSEGQLDITKELYETLIAACASGPLDSMESLAFRLLAEMKESGMKPTAAAYNHLLRLLSKSPNYVRRSQVLAEMHENWYQVSDEADQWVIMGYICDGQLEMAFDKIQRRSELGLDVHMDVYKLLARCLIAFGEVDDALSVLNTVAQKCPQGWQKLPWEQSDNPDVNQWKKLWYDLLRVSGEERNVG
jgi:tetratricopeptide (TPR) repeat protein